MVTMKTLVLLVLCGALFGVVSCKRKIQCRLLQTGGPELATTTTPAPVAQKAFNSSEFEMIMAKLDAVDLRILKTEFAVQNTVQGIASDVENLGRVVEKLAWVASQSEQSSSFVEHHVKLLEHNLTRLQKDVREVLSLQQKLPSRGYIDNALVKLKLQTKLEQDPVNEAKIQQMTEMIETMFKQEQAALNMAMLHIPKDDTYEYCDQLPKNKSSGVYVIHPDKDFQGPIKVFCNQTFNGGGWTVIQRRFDGTVNFYRDYQSYQRGFGKLGGGEFWLGLDRIHRLTYSAPHELVVILEDWDGIKKYASYKNFEVAGEKELYKVTKVDGYTGTAGDSFNYTKNAAFSTFDHDNDTSAKQNCAIKYHGAWWYKSCHSSNLNGKYLRGINSEFGVGMNWDTFRGMNYALKESTIMIRRRMDLVSEVALRLVPQGGNEGGGSGGELGEVNRSQEEHDEIEVEHDQEELRLTDGGVANDDDYEVEVEEVSEPSLAAQREIALKEALSVRTLK